MSQTAAASDPVRHERLSALDTQFLLIEDRSATHMHVGGVMVMDGPAPGHVPFREFCAGRLPLVPRFRQRLQYPPVGSGRPVWVDDAAFDLDFHVRAVALPAPGGHRELTDLVGQVISVRLDRTKPLWELWYVEGLEGGRWAVISKIHHCMVDGVASVDLFAAMADLGPEPRDVPADTWTPEPGPSSAALLARTVRGTVRQVGGLGSSIRSVISNPAGAVRVLDVARGLVDVAGRAIDAPPDTPLNVETGPRRRWTWREYPLADFKKVKDVVGGTVNDVVLAAVGEALAEYLPGLGMDTEGVDLRAEIPQAMRQTGSGGTGNEFVVLAVDLPVGPMPPGDRLHRVNRRMDALKSSHLGTAVGSILATTNFLPPTILAQTTRLVFGAELFNLLVSNVPGLQFPVYMFGRPLVLAAPIAWVGPQQALSVAVVSYNGVMGFGFSADREIVADLERFADAMDVAVARLVALG